MQSENQEVRDQQADSSPSDANEDAATHANDFDQALEDVASNGEASNGEASNGVASNVDADSGSLESRLAEADREVLRAKAEMENFRKRLQREAEQQLKYANLPLVRDLLEAIDNLQRAIAAANEEEGNVQALREGVTMVNEQLMAVLAKYACKPIESLGAPFDPNVHEAIAQAPSDDYPSGDVMQEVAKGYLLHDRVVRPSTVIVSTGKAESS